VLMIFTRKNEL